MIDRATTSIDEGVDIPEIGMHGVVVGQVQGVGFRPFVYRLATELGLRGAVWNDPAGVKIDLFGPASAIREFRTRLRSQAPSFARIDEDCWTQISSGGVSTSAFEIRSSCKEGAPERVTVDSSTCSNCLRELSDKDDRRYQHALINCTECGPRYTIVKDLPYDRPATTMAGFCLCARCEAEYHDPSNRRFHAQPTCCPECGPRLSLILPTGKRAEDDPIAAADQILRAGGVLAIKGLGGYHLSVDASNTQAVRTLRTRKRRDFKPFALLVDSLATARELVRLSGAAERALAGPAAPIVLAEVVASAALPDDIAPGLHRLGVMLPHTPIQHLLVRKGWRVLIMTSANLCDDPLVVDDADARVRLKDIADGWLTHDRPIERAVDDSVVISIGEEIVPIRRARGFVPSPLRLPTRSEQPGLCMGGELKAAIALVIADQVILSQHLGDLNHLLALKRFHAAIADLLRLYRVKPAWIACDAHPAYASHRAARVLAREWSVPLYSVQHHHAHFAGLLAERGHDEPAVGLICDGVGYGDDGAAWGGEILLGDAAESRRWGRLRPLRLPGGDAAARETWRCAISWVADCVGATEARLLVPLVLRGAWQHSEVLQLLDRNLNCPASSGVGRMFDAAAALLGVCTFNDHEAMSGMRLESLASYERVDEDVRSLMPLADVGSLVEIDHRPLGRRLLQGRCAGESPARLARLFHEALTSGLCAAVERAAVESGYRVVGLSGGVFCNSLLTQLIRSRLSSSGFDVLIHRQVPPNDGGLAFGQAAAVASRLQATFKGATHVSGTSGTH